MKAQRGQNYSLTYCLTVLLHQLTIAWMDKGVKRCDSNRKEGLCLSSFPLWLISNCWWRGWVCAEHHQRRAAPQLHQLHHTFCLLFFNLFLYILDVAIGVCETNACQTLTLHPAVMQSHHHTGAVLTETDGVTGSSCFLRKVKRTKGRPAAGLLQTTEFP